MKEKTFKFVYSATIKKTLGGYSIRSLGKRCRVKRGEDIWLCNETTDEKIKLSAFLAGERFSEFDPVALFGTNKPKGKVVCDWLKSQWGGSNFYPASAWISSTVPLPVLLGFGGPLPGVTADKETGWHWSCEMRGTSNPVLKPTEAA